MKLPPVQTDLELEREVIQAFIVIHNFKSNSNLAKMTEAHLKTYYGIDLKKTETSTP